MKIEWVELKIVLVVYAAALTLVLAGCGGGGGSAQETAGPDPAPLTFTLSGLIQAPDTAVIDSDVNDPSAPYAPNDNFIEAQELPNSVLLGVE